MEKASIKLTFLTLFLIAIAIAVPTMEAREPPQTMRIPVVLEVQANEPREPLIMRVAKMEAKELSQLTLSDQLNQPCLACRTNADCVLPLWRNCRDGCCHLF
uniref:Jasmintide 7 n=1 Tax=Jasminum sambac TaxID=660624 RepID=A0A2K9QL72_9LAMI|nr:jasmintide 7 precursor [Jasminum sambac]